MYSSLGGTQAGGIGDFGGGSLKPPRRLVGRPVAGPRSGSIELPTTAGRAMRRHRGRAWALPRVGHSDPAALHARPTEGGYGRRGNAGGEAGDGVLQPQPDEEE